MGDVHIGAASVDEGLFTHMVKAIAADEDAYWIGMGDYCDFIQRSDPRFDPQSLPSWLSQFEPDIARAQVMHFIDLVKPIAHKCLGLIQGNHETTIQRHYERDIYSDIVNAVRQEGGFPPDHKLMLGYGGWLRLRFNRGKNKRNGWSNIVVRLHHGYGGGKLAGAKALNMEKFIWTNDADLCLMGHTHEAGMPLSRSVLALAGNAVTDRNRIGAWTGTFMRSYGLGHDTYAEVKGYYPRPIGGVECILKAHANKYEDRIRIICGI